MPRVLLPLTLACLPGLAALSGAAGAPALDPALPAALEWRRPKFCGGRECPHFRTLHEEDGFEERKYRHKSLWVVTNETGVTWNHAYLHGKVRLAHFWAGDNDRGAKLARTNPMLALFEFGDQGELLPRWTFAGYLPRDCQKDPPQPKSEPACIAPALNASSYYVRPFRGLPTLGKVLNVAADLRTLLQHQGLDFEEQSLAVAIYEPKEPRLGGHHPPLRYRYNEIDDKSGAVRSVGMAAPQEFVIRASGADKAATKHLVARFPLAFRPDPRSDETANAPELKGTGDWTMGQMEQGEARPGTRGLPGQWVLEESSRGRPRFVGQPEGGMRDTGGGYFLLMKGKGNEFIAVPVSDMFTFKPVSQRRHQTLEEAEAAMQAQRLQHERANPRLAKAVARDEEDPLAILKDDEEKEHDSDEEWRAIRERAAARHVVKTAPKQQQRPPSRGQEDEERPEEEHAEKDEKGEDWEHEEAAADDDLDMGESEEEDVGSPVRKGAASSDSEEEGASGALQPEKTKRRLRRMMRATGLEDSEEEEEESAAAPAGLTSVPAAGGGVLTAEELRQLLRSKGRILLADLTAMYKARLAGSEGTKAFVQLVKQVAKMESGSKFLVLKE
ncbi:hypothetical protein COHA_002746 [Chlorella ohadii]|uniref:Transcription initiation factor IIF subunit alpha n=1 Tax=Chlorella ohadii TaxID=2649997 RepID=A0AAD5DVW8_9CHLO|nr:hypothetical protein COHA_002746 [Chlorella ohadii]